MNLFPYDKRGAARRTFTFAQNSSMKDVLGQAIIDYYRGDHTGRLWIRNRYGRKEEMPVEIYFRGHEDMPELELLAMKESRGRILDIGAGAGAHALELQGLGMEVTALEWSPLACAVMKERGVQQVVNENIFDYQDDRFDTWLLLMNGIGLAATIDGLRRFLRHAKRSLAAGGQLLFDSSDVAYLYRKGLPEPEHYYGEIAYQYEYRKEKTDWFTWLYVDWNTLQALAFSEGWKAEQLHADQWGQYLARLSM